MPRMLTVASSGGFLATRSTKLRPVLTTAGCRQAIANGVIASTHQ